MRASWAKRLSACGLIACALAGGEDTVARAQGKTRKPAPVPGAPAAPVSASAPPASAATPAAKELPPQTILPPGLYLYQTRTRDGSCNDAPRTGYVTSAIATLDGVPGSRTMTMQLLNSKYWPTWTLNVTADNAIIGSANMSGAKDDRAGSSRFEIRERKDRGRYQGTGSRNYNATIDGKPTRCTLNYDALLKPLD
jgi:hypothetical protein